MVGTDDEARPTLDDLERVADADCIDYFDFLAAWAAARRCR